jgi:hypothetical protein
MTVAIGFSTTDAWTSRAIRYFTRDAALKPEESPSHAWLLHEAYGSLYVMEAEWRGFRVISYDYFKTQNRVIETHSVVDLLANKGINVRSRVFEMAERLGDAYDWVHFFTFLWPMLSTGQSTKTLLCSEAIVRFAPELFPGVDPERARPSQLMIALRKLANP